MAQVVQMKNPMVRISATDPRKLEASLNKGLSWTVRFHGNIMMGAIYDIELRPDDKLYAYTEKGFYYSPGENCSTFVRTN